MSRNNNEAYHDQWDGRDDPYSSSRGSYASAPYPSASAPHMTSYPSVNPHTGNGYGSSGYYAVAAPSYSQSNATPPVVPQPHIYGSVNGTTSAVRRPHSDAYPQSHPQSSSPSHSYSQSYAQVHPPPQPHPSLYPSSRPRSHSQTMYAQQQPAPMMVPHQSSSHYPSALPLAQPMSSSPQYNDYPASPSRPFSCDMCALSFNRQHDLKRHRETHTGEKPFLCNGGCGKTFTRKDALKRHQLVKGCGKVDDDSSWS